VRDAAGNDATLTLPAAAIFSGEHAIVVDTTAPSYTFNAPTADTYYKNGQTVTVNVTITETGSGITNGANCTPAISGTTSVTGSVLYNATSGECYGVLTIVNGGIDGNKQLTLTVADLAGNSQASSNLQIKIDNTAPSGGAVTYTDGYYTTASVAVTYTNGTDTGSGMNLSSGQLQRKEASLANGTCGSFGSFATIANDSDGSYTDTSVVTNNCYMYQYVITDNAGNTATPYASANVAKVDATAPTVLAVDSDGLTFNTATVSPRTVTVTFSENISNTPTIAVSSSAQSVNDCTDSDSTTFCFTYIIPSATASSMTVQISAAQDLATNTMVADNTHTFDVDTVLPTVTASSPQGTTTMSSPVTINVTTDIAANCRYDFQDRSYATMAYNFSTGQGTTAHTSSVALTTQGLNNIYVTCASLNGSAMSSSVRLYTTLDSVAPTYGLSSVSSSGGMSSGGVVYAKSADTVTVQFTASEAITGTPTVTIGGAAMTWSSYNGSTFTYTRALNGSETTTAIIAISGGTDATGTTATSYNDSGANAEFDFTAPSLSSAVPTTTQTSRTFTVSVDAGEAGITCKYSTNNVAFASMDGTLADMTGGAYQATASVPSDGSYTVYFACRDLAGNLGTANTSAFSVATSTPTITGVSPSGVHTSSLVTLSANTSAAASCQYNTTAFSWGNGTAMTGSSTTHTASLGNLSDATYTYYVLCRDTANNTMSNALAVTFQVNTAANFNYTQQLNLGWNNMPLPRIVLENLSSFSDGNYSVVNVLETNGGIGGSYDYLYYRNGTACSAQNGSCWLSYDPASSVNSLSVFNDWDNLPYWIHMNASDRLELQ